jgi:hypothetical protein
VLVTVFAAGGGEANLAHAVSLALTGSAALLTAALAVIVLVGRTAGEPAEAASEVAAVLD